MPRMVLLHHELPGEGSHFDWMIEPAGTDPTPAPQRGPDDRCLITFRVEQRIDRAGVSSFTGERIENHRIAYLEFEGPLTRNRGSVKRLASGEVALVEEKPGSIRIRGGFSPAAGQEWEGSLRDGLWLFQRLPDAAAQ